MKDLGGDLEDTGGFLDIGFVCLDVLSDFFESTSKHKATFLDVGWLCKCLQGNVSMPAATASAAVCFTNASNAFTHCM